LQTTIGRRMVDAEPLSKSSHRSVAGFWGSTGFYPPAKEARCARVGVFLFAPDSSVDFLLRRFAVRGRRATVSLTPGVLSRARRSATMTPGIRDALAVLSACWLTTVLFVFLSGDYARPPEDLVWVFATVAAGVYLIALGCWKIVHCRRNW